jgi:hypothetical protein
LLKHTIDGSPQVVSVVHHLEPARHPSLEKAAGYTLSYLETADVRTDGQNFACSVGAWRSPVDRSSG